MEMSAKERDALAARFTDGHPLRILLITMSDRANDGVYDDKSGKRLRFHIDQLFRVSGIETEVESKILPDDRRRLHDELAAAESGAAHLVITTGGTGVGPRDITTDVVLEMAGKTIPGVMEAIRMKYSTDKPCTLLSRSVAAIVGSTLVYTLPGSSKGVDEYMSELAKSIPHTLCVLHDLNLH